ncbi:MAG: anthranilate phosphoribosyltransferase [Sphaerobacteraceae bacterium]|nr:MAG: anthranilate phosphoribosyltransferase [Sphaerobacteraceae bacterium]
MIKEAIRRVVAGEYLYREEAAEAMDVIMRGEAEDPQIAALVTALAMRGETEDEIAGFAESMRKHARRVNLPFGEIVVDVVGTGGGGPSTFNISTATAFVVAGTGVKVAKHGNRAITSKCGAADVLEGLGVQIDLEPEAVEDCINTVGIGFMMAPVFHPAMRFAGPTRRAIGIRTIFNVLGPLTNPAGVRYQVLGVSDRDIARKLAKVSELLGAEHVLVVHAEDGLDEFSISSPTHVHEVRRKGGPGLENYRLQPEDVGLQSESLNSILGGDVAMNVEIIRGVLDGKPGGPRSVTLLNAGAAIYAADKAGSISEGIRMAAESIDSGAARERLAALADHSTRLVAPA